MVVPLHSVSTGLPSSTDLVLQYQQDEAQKLDPSSSSPPSFTSSTFFSQSDPQLAPTARLSTSSRGPLSPRQMLAAQQHFGNASLLGVQAQQQQQQQSLKVQDDPQLNVFLPQWQSQDFDQLMRSFLDGQLTTVPAQEAPTDLDLEAMNNFSASHSSSYFSGNSDSGASPSSFHDFIYGSQCFPTPPESEISPSALDTGNMAISVTSGYSPSSFGTGGDFDAATSFTGSDTMSPHYISSLLPFSLSDLQPGASPLSSAYDAPSTSNPHLVALPSIVAASETSNVPNVTSVCDPNFLTPNSSYLVGVPSNAQRPITLAPSTNGHQLQQSQIASTQASLTSSQATKKRPASQTKSKSSPANSNTDDRQTKKLKSSKSNQDATKSSFSEHVAKPSSSDHVAKPISILPHMEVGSNATALAAIERLKANRRKESHEAALSEQLAQMDSNTSNSASIFSRFDGSERPELTPLIRQQKKVAHNAIERRYRNNINDRIAALRRAVPALRELRPRKTPSGRKSRKAQQEDLVDGVAAATKLNKATILGKATEYIKYLKGRELRLASEVAGLRELVRSLEGGEELLELWETEMEKVVAVQEAAAVAKEEEEAFMNPEDDLDGDDDDGEDDDRDASSSLSSSASPSSRRSSQSGRRGAAGTAASSRYMLATFLGVTLFGGEADMSDGTSQVSPAVQAPTMAASRQLLKRSTAYVSPSSTLSQKPHPLDHAPSHVLFLDMARVICLVACFCFLLWPVVVQLVPALRRRRRTARVTRRVAESRSRQLAQLELQRKKYMLSTLGKPTVSPQEIDLALRKFVGAPQSAFFAAPCLLKESVLMAFSWFRSPQPLAHIDQPQEVLAVWVRLLEVETSLCQLAQPSLLLRWHTAFKVAHHQQRYLLTSLSCTDSILSPARVDGTLAIALAKLGDGFEFAQNLADTYWLKARSSMKEKEEEDDDDDGNGNGREDEYPTTESNTAKATATKSSDDGDDVTTSSSADEQDSSRSSSPIASSVLTQSSGWLSSVIKLELDEVLDLLTTPLQIADTLASSKSTSPLLSAKRYRLSPLMAIGDALYNRQLTSVWTSLFSSLVRSSCPMTTSTTDFVSRLDMDPSTPSTVREFCRHQVSQPLQLDLLEDTEQRDTLNSLITHLASTAPPQTQSSVLAKTTLATWALILGKLPVATHLASTFGSIDLESASNQIFVQLVLGATDSPSFADHVPIDALDALAASTLGWLEFLRLLRKSSSSSLIEASLGLRRWLQLARSSCLFLLPTSSTLSNIDQLELEEAQEELIDILSAIGRNLKLSSSSSSSLLQSFLVATESDSGVEF